MCVHVCILSNRLACKERALSQLLMLCSERMASSLTLCRRLCTGLWTRYHNWITGLKHHRVRRYILSLIVTVTQLSSLIQLPLQIHVPPQLIQPFHQVPENLMREIVRNFNKLVKDVQSQESPEAMAYLRIMGAELGYIKGSDLKFIAENAMLYADIFMRIIPSKVLFDTPVIPSMKCLLNNSQLHHHGALILGVTIQGQLKTVDFVFIRPTCCPSLSMRSLPITSSWTTNSYCQQHLACL